MRCRHASTLLAPLALLLLLASPALADPTPSEQLIGAWEWVSSRDAWTGQVTTPATEGYSIQLQFFAEGTATWFQDRSSLYTSAWEFRTNGIDPFVFLYIGGGAYFWEVTQVSLQLDQTFVDGPLMIFARREPVALEPMSWGTVKALFD